MAAATFGASGAPTHGGTRSTISLGAPAGVVAGSLLVAVMFVDGATDLNPTLTGWAQATGSPVEGIDHTMYVFWRRAAGAEAGPFAFAMSGAQYCEGQAHRFDGAVATGDPFEATATANTPTGVTTSPAVSVTALGADRLLLHAATDWSGGTWTAPSGYTKRQQLNDGLSTISERAQAAAGGSGSVTATCTNSGKMTAWLGSVPPADAGGGTPPPRRTCVRPSAAAMRAVW